jgi:hypothetical protein
LCPIFLNDGQECRWKKSRAERATLAQWQELALNGAFFQQFSARIEMDNRRERVDHLSGDTSIVQPELHFIHSICMRSTLKPAIAFSHASRC